MTIQNNLTDLIDDLEKLKAENEEMADSILSIHIDSALREHTDTDRVWVLFEDLYERMTGGDLEAISRSEQEARSEG